MDLSTKYAGLVLRNPLIASPSPANARTDWLERLDAAGIGAVVLPSLFQEQIEAEDAYMLDLLAYGGNNPEASGYIPESAFGPYGIGSYGYLDLIRRAKETLSVPVIASLNGESLAGWTDCARDIDMAGADALELNIYHVPADPSESSNDVEERYLEILRAVLGTVEIPIIVKIPPYFSSPAYMAIQLARAGAAGLVIFNRYLQPDIDLERMKLGRELELSHASEMRLPLLWTAILAGRCPCSLAASSGVETADEVVKFLLAGADAVQTTAAILRNGPEYAKELLNGLCEWLESRGVDSVDKIRGIMSHERIQEPGAYERANYIDLVSKYSRSQRLHNSC